MRCIWPAVLFCFCLSSASALSHRSKTIQVQLYGDLFEVDDNNVVSRTAFLILPDGSRAEALCTDGLASSCNIEPSEAEKRVKVPCELLKARANEHINCYRSEKYEAERKGNDITLRTVNGKVTYHIVGGW